MKSIRDRAIVNNIFDHFDYFTKCKNKKGMKRHELLDVQIDQRKTIDFLLR